VSEPLPKGKTKATDQETLNNLRAEELLMLARRLEREADSGKNRDTLRRVLRTFAKRFPDHEFSEDARNMLALFQRPKTNAKSEVTSKTSTPAVNVAPIAPDQSKERKILEDSIRRVAKERSQQAAIYLAVANGYYMHYRDYAKLHRELARLHPDHPGWKDGASLAFFIESQGGAFKGKTHFGDPAKGSATELVRYVLSGSSAAPANAQNRRQKINDPAGDAKDCLIVSTKGLYGGFENRCNYAINFHYCAVKPTKDSWLTSYDCHKGQGGSWQVGPLKRAGVHTRGAAAISWFACRKDTHEVYEVHFNPSIGKLQGSCVRTGG
jgi:hypothetical protein